MDIKTVKKVTATCYEPWDQCMHVTKLAKNLEQNQKDLKTTGISISDESKLQFYTEQIIENGGMFDKKDIIEWKDKIQADKTRAKAKECFQKLVASEERYASVTGRNAINARFKSAARIVERDDKEID